MRFADEAALLTEQLDRYAGHLTSAFGKSDWTIFWELPPFLAFLHREPGLSNILGDFTDEIERNEKLATRRAEAARDRLRVIVTEAEAQWTPPPEVSELASNTDVNLSEGGPLSRAVEVVYRAAAEGNADNDAGASFLEDIRRLRNALLNARLRHRQFEIAHPGNAYLRLREAARFGFTTTDDPEADDRENTGVTRLLGYIRDAELFGDLPDELPQPGVTTIQRDVRILQLGLATALARGRSRWGIIQRFAARCEVFDRPALIRELEEKSQNAEAVLTLHFAKYLFDVGLNPLIDANACGLRPDVLDSTTEPAVYVEAKQYKRIGPSFPSRLRTDVAQTLSTWVRLRKRWRVPEAFLLVFRRSGRPLLLENSEIGPPGQRLYVIDVDLGDARESGSRAKEPVTVDVQALVGTAFAKARGAPLEPRSRKARAKGPRQGSGTARRRKSAPMRSTPRRKNP